MAVKDVIEARSYYDMMMGVANKRQYKTEKAARLVNEYSRKVNFNMRQLKEAGYDFYAYDAPAAVLEKYGNQKFRTNWTPEMIWENFEEFKDTARVVRGFIKADAHTLTSISRKSQERTNYLLDKFVTDEVLKQRLMNPESEEDKLTKRKLERLVASGNLSDLISEGYGMTGENLEAAVYALESGASVETIEERLEGILPRLQIFEEADRINIQNIRHIIRGKM